MGSFSVIVVMLEYMLFLCPYMFFCIIQQHAHFLFKFSYALGIKKFNFALGQEVLVVILKQLVL